MQENSKTSSANSIVIIGGGIGGLYSAWKLLKKGYRVTLLERQNSLGGLSTSIPYNEYKMDIGPHFVTFPKESELTNEIKAIMSDYIIPIPDIHKAYRAFFNNSVLEKYPILFEIIFKSGLNSFIQSFFSYFISKIKYKNKNFMFTSTEEYLIYNYGKYLYKTWFKPYLDFTYGTDDVPLEIIKTKFPIMKFSDIFKKIRKKTKKQVESKNSSVVDYCYFKYGIGTLPNTLSEKIKNLGGEIILGVDVLSIDHEKNPKDILTMKNGIKKNIQSDIILYTTPPNVTKKWFKEFDEIDFKSSNSANSIMAFLFIDEPKIVDWWLITNYDKSLPFFRICHQSFLSDHVCPSGKSLLCVEISAKDDDELWNLDDALLIEEIKKGLDKMQILDHAKIEDYKIFKFKNLYHGIEPNGHDISEKISNVIDSLKNEFMVGVEIDAGTLVTQRSEEEKNSKPSVSLGGIYMTLAKSESVVKKITS